MQKTKKKTFVLFTVLLSCMIFVGISNPAKTFAFGGDYTVTDPNGSQYSKEAPTQIECSYDASGNLVVSGYSFFLYVQQYLSKGTGVNDTHYYRLKIEGTDFTYNDLLVGGDNYSYIAADNGIDAGRIAGTGDAIYCSNGCALDKNNKQKNTQLQQVSFKFIIPVSDLKKLSEGDHRLVLEHHLTNVKFKSTGNTKHKITFEITKLIDANLTQNTSISENVSTDSGVNKIEVSAIKDFNTLRVNASAVLLRNSSNKTKNDSGSGISGSSYNGGYWTKRTNSSQREIYHKINGSVVKNGLLGEYLIPMECTYNKTTTSSVDISLNELFNRRPDLKNKYEDNINSINSLNRSINNDMNKAKKCTNSNHIKAVDAPCTTCLINSGYYSSISYRDSLISENADIKAMCHTISSSTSEVTATYYCKAIYTEADIYWTSIKVTRKTANINIITRTQKEKENSTELGNITTVNTAMKQIDLNGLPSGIIYSYLSVQHGVIIPKGYHVETVVDSYTNSRVSRVGLPHSRNITFRGSLPVGNIVYVDFVFRNDAPAIKKK